MAPLQGIRRLRRSSNPLCLGLGGCGCFISEVSLGSVYCFFSIRLPQGFDEFVSSVKDPSKLSVSSH